MITPEYIAAITEDELKAEGYQISMSVYPTSHPFLMHAPDGWMSDCRNHQSAWDAAREHWAPRKMLKEALALVREAMDKPRYTPPNIYGVSHYHDALGNNWRSRATDLLGEERHV